VGTDITVVACRSQDTCQDLQEQERQSFIYIKASENEHTLDSKEHAMLLELQHRFKMKMLIYSIGKLSTCYSTKTFQRFFFKLEASLLNALTYVYAFHLLVMFSLF
jgi:hypothetical protein